MATPTVHGSEFVSEETDFKESLDCCQTFASYSALEWVPDTRVPIKRYSTGYHNNPKKCYSHIESRDDVLKGTVRGKIGFLFTKNAKNGSALWILMKLGSNNGVPMLDFS